MTSMHPSAARSTQNSRIIGSKFQIKLGTSFLDGPFRSQFRSVSLTLGALGLVVGRQLGGRRVRGWVGHGLAIIIFRVLRCWVVKLVIQRCRENSGQQFLHLNLLQTFNLCFNLGLLHKIVRFETYLPVGTFPGGWYVCAASCK